MIPRPNNPAAIRITQEPEVGIFLSEEEKDRDFIKLISDGREWVANKKYVKHLRREHASKVS